MHGYVNPIRDSRRRLLGLCECEITRLGTLTNPKNDGDRTEQDRDEEAKGGSYTSEEAKFTRERCIRVAAIVIMITPGVSNIYVQVVRGKNEKSRVSAQRLQRNIRHVMDLIFRNKIESNDQLSDIDG